MKPLLHLLFLAMVGGAIYWFGFYQTPAQKKFATNLAAAEQGDKSAQVLVGDAYLSGRGTPQDPAQALEWFRKAAFGGNKEAQWRCAEAYLTGKLGPQDDEEAALFLTLAAKQGDSRAQWELARFYAEGKGGLTAHHGQWAFWLRRAAQDGHPMAREKWLELEQNEPELAAQIKQFSQDLAAAQDGDEASRVRMGQAYLAGEPILQNNEEALRWLTLAWQENQVPQAGYMLAQMYQTGNGTEADEETAQALWRELAQLPYAPAQFMLGDRAFRSDPPQYEQALVWFTKAAKEGYAPAQYQTGVMLLRGQGVERPSADKGVAWLTQAANQNYVQAQYILGWAYLKGYKNIPRSTPAARRWLEAAAKNGSAEAQDLLATMRHK